MTDIGQAPIVMAKEIDGFVMNRLQSVLLHEAFRLVAEGYASMEDVDIGIRDGLGLRWAFMGPFETIDLNAPQGIEDYVRRLGPMYSRMFESQNYKVDWTEPARALAAEAEGFRPRADLAKRQVWRDIRLMALREHKRMAEEKFGA